MSVDRVSFKPSPQVLCRKLGEGAVLIHLETNQIYELNSTGHRIWVLIEGGVEREAIKEALRQEFDVPADHLTGQVDQMLARFSAEQLITPTV